MPVPEDFVPEAAPAVPVPDNEPQSAAQAREMLQAAGRPETTPVPAMTEPAAAPTADEVALAALEASPADAPDTPPAVPEGTDPYAQWGGEARVREAMAIRDGLDTPAGIRLMAGNTLTALGYSSEQVGQLLAQPGAAEQVVAAAAQGGAAQTPAADPFAGIGDDDVVTGGELKQFLQAALDQQKTQFEQTVAQQQQSAIIPLQEQLAQQAAQAETAVVDSTLVELLGPVPEDQKGQEDMGTQARGILEAAMPYIDPAQRSNPDHLRAAILRGNADYKAESEARLAAFLRGKKAQAAAVPTSTTGGSPGGEPAPEPKDARDATRMLKEAGLY